MSGKNLPLTGQPTGYQKSQSERLEKQQNQTNLEDSNRAVINRYRKNPNNQYQSLSTNSNQFTQSLQKNLIQCSPSNNLQSKPEQYQHESKNVNLPEKFFETNFDLPTYSSDSSVSSFEKLTLPNMVTSESTNLVEKKVETQVKDGNPWNKLTDFLDASNVESVREAEAKRKAGEQSMVAETVAPEQSTPEPSTPALPPVPEYNILLLGETGAGKSTTVNAMANYFRFGGDFAKAAHSDHFEELISSRFSLPNPETGDDILVCSGQDSNESHANLGESCTQHAMAYKFRHDDKVLRIIDTPGMGDTRGMATDQRNFDNTMRYLEHYKHLHAICIVLKVTQTKLVASFRYCLGELLAHLHRNACHNLVFCFTFARSTFYTAGDAFFALKHYLADEFPEMQLNLRPGENCFFVDNEAYRFLVARKCGYPFKPRQIYSFQESWNRSAAATKQMITRMMTLTPHNLEETFQLNRARKLILALVQPMVQLQLNIAQKRSVLEAILAAHCPHNLDYLEAALYTKCMDLQIHRLWPPMTVCTAQQCIQLCPLGGNSMAATVQYSAQCHSECTEIEPDNCAIGHPLLHDCLVIAPESGKCRSCGCSWRVHMQLAVRYDHKLISLFGKQQIETIVGNAKSLVEVETQLIETVQKYIAQLIEALDNICKFSGLYGCILDRCSNQSYSQFVDQYVSMLEAEEEKKKAVIEGYSSEMYEQLQDLRQRQQQAIDKLATQKEFEFDLKSVPQLCEFFRKRLQTEPKFGQLIDMFTKEETKAQKPHVERVGVNMNTVQS